MPQASAELQNKMFGYYGSHTDDVGPIAFLEKQGFDLGKDWVWRKPGIYNRKQLSQQELDSIWFLMEEWDFGGIEYDRIVDDG